MASSSQAAIARAHRRAICASTSPSLLGFTLVLPPIVAHKHQRLRKVGASLSLHPLNLNFHYRRFYTMSKLRYTVEILTDHSPAYFYTNDQGEAVKTAADWNCGGFEVRLIENKTKVLAH